MYRFKQDNGQIFGYYQPWLHEHEHEHEVQYHEGDDFSVPTLVAHEEEYEEVDDEEEE